MFKESRKKIVVSIMVVLILLWVGTLGIIYVTSYLDMTERNKRMLREYSERYLLPDEIEKIAPQMPMHPKDNQFPMKSPSFMLTTFYSAAFSYSGELLQIENNQTTVHSNEELEKLARKVIDGGTKTGKEKNLLFYQSDKGDYLLVSFMDNTIIHESMTTLFRYTLFFGGLAICAFFFLALYLAKKIVKPLEESYQKQKQFISDAGHELKTPVSVVSANEEILRREIGENQWLSNIRYENEHMGMLINQLLQLARTESGEPQMQKTNFSRIVNSELLSFESVSYEKGFCLNSHITDDMFVNGNEVQLAQIVAILLDNAIQHSEGEKKITVKLDKQHSTAVLTVTNHGKEITNEEREKVFERFYRLDYSRNSEGAHYGLGLSIAKAIITAHKGQIEMMSNAGVIEVRVQLPVI